MNFRSKAQHRYANQKDKYCSHCRQPILSKDSQETDKLSSRASEDIHGYRERYLNTNNNRPSSQLTTSYSEREYFASRTLSTAGSGSSVFGSMTRTQSSLLSPSTNNLPTENISRAQLTADSKLRHSNSILQRIYSKQIQPI